MLTRFSLRPLGKASGYPVGGPGLRPWSTRPGPAAQHEGGHEMARDSFVARYGKMVSVAAAASPLAVHVKALPAFAQQRGMLGGLTSILTFLLTSYAFYVRKQVSPLLQCDRVGISRRLRWFLLFLPTLLGILGFASFVWYFFLVRKDAALLGPGRPFSTILATAEVDDLPHGTGQVLLFMLTFLFWQCAFLIMALKEPSAAQVSVEGQ